MLGLDLMRLAREGTVHVDGRIAARDGLWEGSGLAFDGPLSVSLAASRALSGEVIVRGRLEGTLRHECRRCLEPVGETLREDVTMVFVEAGEPGAEEGGDVRPIAAGTAELDLSEAVREEVILAAERFVVCEPECKGLCARCGANLNEGSCGCTFAEVDPRWDALRSLTGE